MQNISTIVCFVSWQQKFCFFLNNKYNLILVYMFSISEQKAAIGLEKDKAKMAEAFLELDDNADGV